jgi:hypothetical protein
MKKKILVVAKHNHAEALRVAVGLTLLSDDVRAVVLGELEDSPEVREQREVMEFAEVPCNILAQDGQAMTELARDVLSSDVVYVI